MVSNENNSADTGNIIPNAKTKRYDRQLRIWGMHGQTALENAQICLLHSGPTGSETLKNLVLGGIGGFTIVDDAIVSSRDLGNNFMLAASQLGRARAAAVSDNLKELNDAVEGSYVDTNPHQLIDEQPTFFERFNLVIATQLEETYAHKLDDICRGANVPLLLARSYGLIGSVRISMAEHVVIESKPDNQLDDLRLAHPWPALQHYAESIDLHALDDVHHKHVPYVVLLLQAAAQWRATHNNQLPKGSKQQAEFKSLVKGMQRHKEGIPLEELNVQEAAANANKLWASSGIPPEVQRVLDDGAATDISTQSPDFWIMAAAVKRFVDNEGQGQLPLQGSLPDMTATTDQYLQLSSIYRTKAESDTTAIEGHVKQILQALGRGKDEIGTRAIKMFCGNARNLRVVRFKTLQEEGSGSYAAETLKRLLMSEESAVSAAMYVLLRAADKYKQEHKRFPGSENEDDLEGDVVTLKSTATQLLHHMGCAGTPLSDEVVAEMVRYGAGELQCVAAVIGGMASQEAIKLLTRQFVPLHGTLLYNAVSSTTLLVV